MKKKIWIPIVILFLLLAILFVPIPQESYDDGGTREWTALTYKLVDWNRIYDGGTFDETRIYFGSDRRKSIDALWSMEQKEAGLPVREYTGTWLDKETAQRYDDHMEDNFIITQIYSDCFFAAHVIPMPYTVKINGSVAEQWCVGDQVLVTFDEYYVDEEFRMECDMKSIAVSTFRPDPNAAYKPVIYLYPQEETVVSVKLRLDGRLTCTYPAYQSGWRVTAAPDGTLTDAAGKIYNYLYWEGETYAQWDMRSGFCVKGEDTAVFLEDALMKLGLNRREANEFIVYWLPLMEKNPYNIISFQTDVYTQAAELDISPQPDTLIRVFMAWKPSDAAVTIPAQELTAPMRTGFTVVEWGGTEVQ